MATPDLTLISEATINEKLAPTLASAKSYTDTKTVEAIAAAAIDATNKANAAKWTKAGLGSSVDLDTLVEPGEYSFASFAIANLVVGLPSPASGNFIVHGGQYPRQEWITTGLSSRPNERWQRERITATQWTTWWRTDARSVDVFVKTGLGTSTNLDTLLAPGEYPINSYAIASQIVGLPSPAAGTFTVHPGNYPIQEWATSGLSSRPNEKWQRESPEAGVWTEWWRTDVRAAVPTPTTPDGGTSGSGFKVVPLSVTLPGVGSSFNTVTEKSERHMMGWAAPVSRWRVHIRNGEYRTNVFNEGAITFNGLWFGKHEMPAGTPTGNYTAVPSKIANAFTSPADGSEWVSPWITSPLEAGAEYLLSYGFTVPVGTTFAYHTGQSFSSTSQVNAGEQNVPGGSGRSILDVWIEAETPATTPVIGGIGSSSSVGTGAQWPVWEAPVSLYARERGALPVFYGGAGETMLNASNFQWEKWSQWANLAKPDAIINAIGSNDVFGGATLAQMKERYETLNTFLRDSITPNIYLTTIPPRTNVTGSAETVRRQYNAWMRLQGRDVFEFALAVSDDDETMIPAMDSGDGVHPSTAGHKASAAAIVRPVTTLPIDYDTKWYDVSADLMNGWTGELHVRRDGNTVWYRVRYLDPATATAHAFYQQVEGLRIWQTYAADPDLDAYTDTTYRIARNMELPAISQYWRQWSFVADETMPASMPGVKV